MRRNEIRKERIEELITAGKLAAHDVKSKLTPCRLAIFLIKEKLSRGKISTEEILETFRIIESSSKAIERIVTNYETILYKQVFGWKEINKVFEEAVSRFSELKTRNIDIVCECKRLYLWADSRLTPVLSNLIDNSEKYAGENFSEIRLSYSEGEQGLIIIYSDNGKGIKKEEKEEIFKEGYGEGTGRGLYLIREILKHYGCLIEEKGEFGKGAEFFISVPREKYRIK